MKVHNAISSSRHRRRHLLFAVCLLLFAFLSAACRQDMHDQPKYKPLRESPLFRDSRSARPLVEGVVARGFLRDDSEYYTGKLGQGQAAGAAGAQPTGAQPMGATGTTTDTQRVSTSASNQTSPAGTSPTGTSPVSPSPAGTGEFAGYTALFPFPIDRAALDRGEERFNIYCSVCHGRLGDGQGMIVKRGYRQPPTYHQDRLRQAPAGYIFDVITNGFGAMPDYAAQIPVDDRWKIVAYVRALQLSQQGTAADVPPGQKIGIPSEAEAEQKQGEHNQ
jgi:mono/diheme cytochrome c family protein